MKAAVWTSDGVLEVKYVAKPKLTKRDYALVRVRASGICGSDLKSWRVSRPERTGKITGHELAGEVVEIGPDVRNVKVGDRVAIESLVSCGNCRWCRTGMYHLCPDLSKLRGETLMRGFSEFVAGPSDKLLRLKDHVKMEWAPLLDCYAVNVHAFQVADLKMYETIAIIGQGPMGLSMTDIANAVGVKSIAIALRDHPLSVARKVGAWRIINSSKDDPVDKALEYTNGFGVDTVFLQVGGYNPNPIVQALRMTKKGGKVMIVGLPTDGFSLDKFDLDLLWGERAVQFVNNLFLTSLLRIVIHLKRSTMHLMLQRIRSLPTL
jgi:threonine dehydrogenase-like Zn-dependent dehydrogenase